MDTESEERVWGRRVNTTGGGHKGRRVNTAGGEYGVEG